MIPTRTVDDPIKRRACPFPSLLSMVGVSTMETLL